MNTLLAGDRVEEHFSVNVLLTNKDNLFLQAVCSCLFFFFLLLILLFYGECFPSRIQPIIPEDRYSNFCLFQTQIFWGSFTHLGFSYQLPKNWELSMHCSCESYSRKLPSKTDYWKDIMVYKLLNFRLRFLDSFSRFLTAKLA